MGVEGWMLRDNNECLGIVEAKDASGKNLWNTCAAFTVLTVICQSNVSQ